MGDVTNKETIISSSSSSPCKIDIEELQLIEKAPPFRRNTKRNLAKQVSMLETKRELAWERRRRQKLMQERRNINPSELSDEDLNELKGCIELGFGFNEEEGGKKLTNTLPALDLYFHVNRLGSPMMIPKGAGLPISKLAGIGSSSSRSLGSRKSSTFGSEDSWMNCSPGEDPQQVKTKLRHWAQVVACSVMQSS